MAESTEELKQAPYDFKPAAADLSVSGGPPVSDWCQYAMNGLGITGDDYTPPEDAPTWYGKVKAELEEQRPAIAVRADRVVDLVAGGRGADELLDDIAELATYEQNARGEELTAEEHEYVNELAETVSDGLEALKQHWRYEVHCP